ncbi:hypothetical protein B9T33_09350 [Acinetobacter sp. ANC 5054]|nr:hypothetical protein B9T33_09350 [Acinetobacter sp. ANC 5054]
MLCLLFSVQLIACQSQYVTTPNVATEAALVAESVDNGISTEIDIPYLSAFRNLRQAYNHCVAFSAGEHYVYTDNRLEEHLEQGTLMARTENGAFLHKMLVEGMSADKTRITLFLPAKFHFAQSRFKQDIQRALGQDKNCNTYEFAQS